MKLRIKCPNCNQLFQVEEKFEGKMVECGTCDTRFKIDHEVMIQEKKRIYPGENKSELLDRISRSPAAAQPEQSVTFQTTQYTPNANASATIPATTGQMAAAAGGIFLLICVTLLFLFGSEPGGPLQDIHLIQRIVLGGFTCLIGAALLVFGAKSWRGKSILLALTLIGVVAALIFIQPIHQTPGGQNYETNFELDQDKSSDEIIPKENETQMLKKKVGYEQIQRQIDEADHPESVVGVYLYPYEESHQSILTSYFNRKFQLSKIQIPSTYLRDSGQALLMVFSDLSLSFDEALSHCELLGSVTAHPEHHLLEVRLASSHFKEATNELYQKLTDSTNPEFSSANLSELRHVDFFRAKKAVERIDIVSDPSGLSLKPEVSKELVRLLLENDDSDFGSDLGNALQTWAGTHSETAEKAGEIVASRLDTPIAKSLVDYLIEAKASQTPIIVDGLWARNPLNWSEQYEALGSLAEDRLLYHLKNSPLALKKSAVEILRKIGTKKSLPILRSAKNSDDVDFRITINRTIETIQSRQ